MQLFLMAVAGGKKQSILTLSMSAIPHKHDLVWGDCGRSCHLLSLQIGALRVALLKCRLGFHRWEFAVIVLLLH